MRIDKRQEVLVTLFHAFSSTYSFYVIGAGASAGVVPRGAELSSRNKSWFSSFGSFSATPYELDDIFYRMVANKNDIKSHITFPPLTHFPPSAAHAMTVKQLTPAGSLTNIHAYDILTLIRKPSTIFSLNVDGLATKYGSGHYLLEPHGRVPSSLVPYWDGLINILLEYDLPMPEIPGLLLPQPEPVTITSNEAYPIAISLLKYANFVVFIGYSFGRFGDSFDDYETFEFFREQLIYRRKEVIVVDPHPELIGNMLQEAAKDIKVNFLPIYWNHFCRAIKEIIIERAYHIRDFTNWSDFSKQILYRHDELRDGFL